MNALAFVFAWVLTFTAPAHDSGLSMPCPIGCRDTSTAAAACSDATTFEVWRHRQSPTWVANRAAMLSNVTTFTTLWPAVRAEAGYFLVTTRPTTAAEAGKACTITLPDTMQTGWFYTVTTLDASGNRACMSPEVFR